MGSDTMSKHIGLTLRIGSTRDELTVDNSGTISTFDRSKMVGLQKKHLSRDVVNVRRHNAALSVL
jgi:hypothetical protein